MTQLYNLTELKYKRRSLRKNPPSPEILVWHKLRNRQVGGCKFKRQYSIDNFILDFFCPELKLAVEIDGDSHYQIEAVTKDRARQSSLEKLGIKFLRFTNLEASSNIEAVIDVIESFIRDLKTSPRPSPYQGEGENQDSSPLQGEAR